MRQFKIKIPTYNAARYPEQVEAGAMPEFSPPHTPILVHEAEGLHIVLGTHDYNDFNKPDIQIERRPHGWAIFLHPVGGSDASGYVYFTDDGRSFVLPENGLGPTTPIQFVKHGDAVPEMDPP